ncbi:MAG: TolC family protein, partial [Candidatus Sumerlaeota bacterium]
MRHTIVLLIYIVTGSLLLTGCASHVRVAYDGQKTMMMEKSVGEARADTALEEADKLELQAVRDMALRRNPSIRAAYADWQAAVEKIPQVIAPPDPMFSYGYFVQEVETRVGPQRHRFGLSQAFPWFGKLRLQGEAAVQDAFAAAERFEMQRLEVYRRATNAWLEYYYLERSIATTRENFTLLSDLEKVLQAGFRTGRGLADLSNIQMELARLEDRIA